MVKKAPVTEADMKSALERVENGVLTRKFNSQSTSYMDDLKTVIQYCHELEKTNQVLLNKANINAGGQSH